MRHETQQFQCHKRETQGSLKKHWLPFPIALLKTYTLTLDSSQLICETDGSGSPIRDYVYLNGELVAMQLYEDGAGWYYFVNDHLGTPQKVVDASVSVVWEAGYLPFGEARLLVADIENNLRFPGQYFDGETGLHYNWNRYYDPETGRYWSADPIGLSGGIIVPVI